MRATGDAHDAMLSWMLLHLFSTSTGPAALEIASTTYRQGCKQVAPTSVGELHAVWSQPMNRG